MANEANAATEANETEGHRQRSHEEAIWSIETIDACLPDYYLSIKNIEWYFGICIDRSVRNNQLGSCHICIDRSSRNNQLGSSCNNELVVINADLDKEAVEVDKANELDETNEANVADRTNLANEANEVSLSDKADDVVESDVSNKAYLAG